MNTINRWRLPIDCRLNNEPAAVTSLVSFHNHLRCLSKTRPNLPPLYRRLKLSALIWLRRRTRPSLWYLILSPSTPRSPWRTSPSTPPGYWPLPGRRRTPPAAVSVPASARPLAGPRTPRRDCLWTGSDCCPPTPQGQQTSLIDFSPDRPEHFN